MRSPFKVRCKPFIPETPAKIALVGEAPGKDEEVTGLPFMGSSGQELHRMLKEAGIEKSQCFQTNVFMDRPPDNKLEAWCDQKRAVSEAYKLVRPHLQAEYPAFSWPEKYEWDKIKNGKYIHPRFLFELPRLQRELAELKPNLIVALGGTAAWALLGASGIDKIRGATTECVLVPGLKVLPTYHPAYILRSWSDRVICLADFEKAKREAESPAIRRPRRNVFLPDTIADLYTFYGLYLSRAADIATDVETHGGQITCISFAPDREKSLVVPFLDRRKPDYNFWPTPQEEVKALKFCRMVLESPIQKTMQNGLYDTQYMARYFRCWPKNFRRDTMIAHHSLQPELQKGLGFLGSIYTDEAAWKIMRKRAKDELKKDD